MKNEDIDLSDIDDIDPLDLDYLDEDEEEEQEIYKDHEYDNLLVDLRDIKEKISKGDLFEAYNILNSDEFDHSHFNNEGFYRLSMMGDELEDMMFLGSEYFNVDPMLLKNENNGINWADELVGDEIVQLETAIESNNIIIHAFPDPDHWQYEFKIVFINLDPYS
tara:strand:- start:451 stop:942 length:492 start_codon:yes stop_codon:yes gene_type:complete